MKPRSVVLLILMCVVSISFNALGATTAPANSTGVSSSRFQVVEQTGKQIKLHFSSPQLEMSPGTRAGFSSLKMAGAENSADEGYPSLPVFSTWVAIPGRGDFRIRVNSSMPILKGNIKPEPAFATDEQAAMFSLDDAAYRSSENYPASNYTHGSAQIIRDFRVVQLNLCPVQYQASENSLWVTSDFEIMIDMLDSPGQNELGDYTSYSYAFRNLYESMICNFAQYRDVMMAPLSPRMLIIHGNNSDQVFLTKLAEFVAWKRQKGFEVSTVSTSQTGGSSNTAIKTYIQNQYNNAATRPDYIVLLGDTSGSYTVPTFTENFSSYGGEGDYPYTQLAGSDYLGDVFIGRISAENISQLDVLFNKIYAVEKNINLSGNSAAWLNRMLLVGDPTSSGISTQYINKFIKEMALLKNPQYTFIEQYSSGFAAAMNTGINTGVGIFNYRGYINMSGWSPSSSLVNGTMLPHATILTCATGNFAGGTGTTEALMRLGTSASPAGSVTAIGMATSGTHTMFNNCLVAGIYDGIFTYGMRTMGEALLNGKLYIKQVYGATLDTQANYFAHWCNLMGDPTVEVFIGIPQQFTVVAPVSLAMGTGLIDVSALDNLGLPVEGACVTAYSSSLQAVVGKAYTDAEGNATLVISGGLTGDVLLTVSKHGFKPLQQTVGVDATGSLVYYNKTLVDNGSSGSSGNGDGFANAGETIAMNLEIKNTTGLAVNAINAVLSSSDPSVTIVNNQTTFGNLEAGATGIATGSLTFSIGHNIPPYHDIRFELQLTDGNMENYNTVFHVSSYNANLAVQNHSVSAGGNAILDPSEQGALTVNIKNNSISAINDVYAELHSMNDLLVISDSLSFIGSIPAGAVSPTLDGFSVFARAMLIPGMQMPLRLRLFNDSGFEQFAVFNLPIGQVSQNTPLGPDAYGYFIYDVTDTGYPDCPTYQWIEIHPSEGGPGTQITGFVDPGSSGDEGDQNGAVALQQVQLPFAFPFYGVSYNMITVCVNGFIVMGQTANGEFRNYHIPGGYGPNPMIAPFWDDLIIIGDAGIYKYYDAANHKFIIQYHKMRNGYNRTSLETFQVIFFDPLYYPTSLGDGMIKIQYKDFNNVDVGGGGYTPVHGNYSTIGIKDHTNTRGLEYSFNNQYPFAAAPLSSQKALMITTVPVLHESAFLILEDVVISDSNNNGIAEPGEAVELGIKLQNLGINPATSVVLTATENSDYASLSIANSQYSDIPGDETGINHDPITLNIDLFCPDGIVIPVVCNVSIAGNSWQFPISVTVHKPAIQVSGMYMNDTMGNSNGLIDPGETLELIINYQNNSTLEAKNITSNIMCLSEAVTISNPSQLLAGIPAGCISQAVYQISVSPDVIVGNNLTFYLTYLGDLIDPHNEQLVLSVGTTGMSTDFETNNGGFTASPGTNGWEWGVSQVAGAHSGTKVWGTRLNSQYPANVTYLLTTPSIYVGSNFMLEFWHWYNTEAGYDGGNVKISTNNGSSWSVLTPVGGYTSNSLSILGGPGYEGTSGGWVLARFNLASYANQNVSFRFTFASDGLYEGDGWFIDDVRTTGYVEFAGKVHGSVTSSDPDIDFSTVNVHNSQSWTIHPDTTGSYALYLPVGSHGIKAEANGYNSPAIVNVSLSLTNPESVQDFYLGYFNPASDLGYGVASGSIYLSWAAATEPEFVSTGFDVYRKVDAGAFELAQHVTQTQYSQVLGELGTKYSFYVVATYVEGNSLPSNQIVYTYSSADEDNNNPALVTALQNNYPNPFNPETTIRFSLKQAMPARLSIYNLKGQLVKTLVDGQLTEGMHNAVWNGKDNNNRSVASGVYFYRLKAGSYVSTRKMILTK